MLVVYLLLLLRGWWYGDFQSWVSWRKLKNFDIIWNRTEKFSYHAKLASQGLCLYFQANFCLISLFFSRTREQPLLISSLSDFTLILKHWYSVRWIFSFVMVWKGLLVIVDTTRKTLVRLQDRSIIFHTIGIEVTNKFLLPKFYQYLRNLD